MVDRCKAVSREGGSGLARLKALLCQVWGRLHRKEKVLESTPGILGE